MQKRKIAAIILAGFGVFLLASCGAETVDGKVTESASVTEGDYGELSALSIESIEISDEESTAYTQTTKLATSDKSEAATKAATTTVTTTTEASTTKADTEKATTTTTTQAAKTTTKPADPTSSTAAATKPATSGTTVPTTAAKEESTTVTLPTGPNEPFELPEIPI